MRVFSSIPRSAVSRVFMNRSCRPLRVSCWSAESSHGVNRRFLSRSVRAIFMPPAALAWDTMMISSMWIRRPDVASCATSVERIWNTCSKLRASRFRCVG